MRLVATHLRSRVRGICRVLRGVRRCLSLFVGFRFLARVRFGGSAFGSSGVVGYAVLTQQTQRAQLRMDATYPIEMPSLGFETLSVLRWHSWTVGAHGLLGRKGGMVPPGRIPTHCMVRGA